MRMLDHRNFLLYEPDLRSAIHTAAFICRIRTTSFALRLYYKETAPKMIAL